MKGELCFDNDCLDLPSLTEIQGNGKCIHERMGHVILESMIWFDLITRHSKSHWKQHSLWRMFIFLHFRCASNKYFSFHFHFHILDAPALEKVIRELPKKLRYYWKPHFSHSLKEEKKNHVLLLSKSSIVLFWLNFCCLFNSIQFQTFSQSNRERVSSSLTNAKNHISFFIESH